MTYSSYKFKLLQHPHFSFTDWFNLCFFRFYITWFTWCFPIPFSPLSPKPHRLFPGMWPERHQEDDFCAKWNLDRPARLLLRELPPDLREQVGETSFIPSGGIMWKRFFGGTSREFDFFFKKQMAMVTLFQKEMSEGKEGMTVQLECWFGMIWWCWWWLIEPMFRIG